MNINLNLYEIFVPTQYGDTLKPIRTRHHKEWDKRIRAISGGLTICSPSRGQWVNPKDKKVVEEKVIPVRIACSEKQMEKIVKITLDHYRQNAVMFFLLSDKVIIAHKGPPLIKSSAIIKLRK